MAGMSEARSALMPAALQRCRLRFTLRTLLALLTVVGIWLGMERNRAVRQHRAVETVRKYGGMVGYRHQRTEPLNWDASLQPWAPGWLRKTVGDDYFVSVFAVYLANYGNPIDPPLDVLARLTDDDFGCLGDLDGLKRLDLAAAPVTAKQLESLANAPRIQSLDLRDTVITDEHLEQLGRFRNLKDLRLGSSPLRRSNSPACESKITARGLSHLKHLSQLKTFFIGDVPLSDDAVEELGNLIALRYLWLGATKLTDDQAAMIDRRLPMCIVERRAK